MKMFLRPELFFNESVCFFLASGILQHSAVPFFSYEFIGFLRPELFFQ